MKVIPGAQVWHALIIDVIQLRCSGALTGLQLSGAVFLSVGKTVHLPIREIRQHRHAGVQGVSVVGRMRVLISVLVGQQREEALAGFLGDASRPGETVGRWWRWGVAVWWRWSWWQEWCIGLLSDNLQTQVLLMREGYSVVQHHGTIVLFAAGHTPANSTTAAAATASSQAP